MPEWLQEVAEDAAPGSARHRLESAVGGGAVLLHGSSTPGLDRLDPRSPDDASPDDFSSEHGVFASSDAIWAICYALRGPEVAGMLNSCVQLHQGGVWSRPRHFLSLAPTTGRAADPRRLLSPGWVYVLPRAPFARMEPYDWPGVGRVLEAQWRSPTSVPVLDAVRVEPADLPLVIHSHDAEAVRRANVRDPGGFPWW